MGHLESISPNFCPVPWTQISFSALGTLRLCCRVQANKGLARNEDGSLFRMPFDLDQGLNCSNFVETRRKMLAGEDVADCASCTNQEKVNGHSMRKVMLDKYKDYHFSDLSVNLKAETMDYLDIRLGNLCNLKCRMCSPYSSSKWLEDWQKLGDLVDPIKPSDIERMRSHWWEDEKTWDSLKVSLKNVRQIYMTGGEPILAKMNEHLLKELIDMKRAHEVELLYHTNGTIYGDHLVRLWSHFKKVTLRISVDGIGGVNNYIRYPSVWDDVLNNIRLYKKAAEHIPLEIYISCTVQALNIFQCPEMDAFFKELGIPVLFNMLYQPQFLSISVLPPGVALKAFNKISGQETSEQLVRMLPHLNSKYSSQWQRFLDFNAALDSGRNVRLFDVVPELGPGGDTGTLATLN